MARYFIGAITAGLLWSLSDAAHYYLPRKSITLKLGSREATYALSIVLLRVAAVIIVVVLFVDLILSYGL